MLFWEHLGAIPALQDLWKLGDQVLRSSEKRSPGLLVLDRQPLPMTTVIKKATETSVTILCGLHFSEGDDLLASLYAREELQDKNIELKVLKVNRFEQTIECAFTNVDEKTKKLVNDCA
jgi:hypothetical protein